ncbi:hypothetical protein AB4Z54_72630, partial [Streptomyces sp. MCAF7]
RGLVTVPTFTEGTLDSQIAVLAGGAEPDESGASAVTRLSSSTGLPTAVQSALYTAGSLSDEMARSAFQSATARLADQLPDEETETQTIAYRVSNLESANRMPESVRVGDSLGTAMTIMVLRGYSQLPV